MREIDALGYRTLQLVVETDPLNLLIEDEQVGPRSNGADQLPAQPLAGHDAEAALHLARRRELVHQAGQQAGWPRPGAHENG